MKEHLWEFLDFTPTEKRGLFLFFLCVGLLFIIPNVYSKFLQPEPFDASGFEADIEKWEAGLIEKDAKGKKKYFEQNWDYEPSYKRKKKKSYPKKKEVKINSFPFDPNKAPKAKLLALGLPENVVSTLINFREKGGSFYQKEDLKKVYGFKKEWYDALENNIQIQKKEYPKKEFNSVKQSPIEEQNKEEKPKEVIKEKEPTKYKPKPKPVYKPIIVDLNTSSAEELQKVRGIGPSFSKRIVKYRKSLGGFTDITQVSEVYGMPDSTYQNIKGSLTLHSKKVQTININTATTDDLKMHPYLSWKLANAIVKYRKTHGDFSSVDDLKKIYALDSKLITKLKPYLTVE